MQRTNDHRPTTDDRRTTTNVRQQALKNQRTKLIRKDNLRSTLGGRVFLCISDYDYQQLGLVQLGGFPVLNKFFVVPRNSCPGLKRKNPVI